MRVLQVDYNVGWTAVGEWLEYTVNVNETTTYRAEFLTSSLNGGGSLALELNGTTVLTESTVPISNDWNTYNTFTKEVSLIKGTHILRINITKAGFNLDKITFTKKPTCSLTSYVNINGGGWNQSDTIEVNVGGTVWFGPQSSTTQGQNTPGWSWTGPNTFTSNQRDNTITNIQPENAGVYKVSYTDPNGCLASRDIIINSPCDIIPYVNINSEGWNEVSEVEVNEGEVLFFGPQSNITGVTTIGWNWTGPNNFSGETRSVTLNNIDINDGGIYTASYTTPSGCQSSHEFNISVITSPVTALETNKSNNDALSVYPNPSSNGEFKLSQSVKWEVYSTQGALISKGEGHVIDLGDKPEGNYLLKTPATIEKIIIP